MKKEDQFPRSGLQLSEPPFILWVDPQMEQKQITVIGGGIVGITTAIHLAESGYRTTVLTKLRLDRHYDVRTHPHFASLFPAACVLPHTVTMPDLLETFRVSQKVFSELTADRESGVRWQEHYELHSGNIRPLPLYARGLHACSAYGSSPAHLPFADALGTEVSGWVARVLFAEMPRYAAYLYRRFLSAGGEIIDAEVELDQIQDIPGDAIVNCSGLGARTLMGDTEVYPIRGHLLFVHGCPFPPQPDGHLFSYNYTPSSPEYPFDVYFFPRAGGGESERGWLLGGSREAGKSDGRGGWQFRDQNYETIGGFPSQVYELNRRILKSLTGTDIQGFELSQKTGYRPGRNGGVRIETSQEGGRRMIHNYGHGGAGVALSWGSAARVKGLLENV